MENRTHQRLAAELPPHPGPLRPHPHSLSGILPLRLSPHHLEAFMQLALDIFQLISDYQRKNLCLARVFKQLFGVIWVIDPKKRIGWDCTSGDWTRKNRYEDGNCGEMSIDQPARNLP